MTVQGSFHAELKADGLISKILAFKREKYGILRRAATKAAKPMVAALRQAITQSVGIGGAKSKAQAEYLAKRKEYERKKRNQALFKQIATEFKPIAKEAKQWAKSIKKFSGNLLRKSAKDLFGIKIAKRKKNTTKPVKVEKSKPPRLTKPKKVKVSRPRKYGLHEITKMIASHPEKSRLAEKQIMREIIENRKLLGGAANQKNGMVNTIGMTGGLAKSINFKISMAKPKRTAFNSAGDVIGGTGMKPTGTSQDWVKPIWKSVSSNRVVLLVGATKRPQVVWNPFVKRLQKVNPKRYLHLIEGGHVLVIRRRKRGKVAGRRPLAKTFAAKKFQLVTNVKKALAEELQKVLAKKGGG